MSHFKLLCLDIDGTLHDSQHIITPAVRTAVRWAREKKNIIVALTSGRIPSNLAMEQKELGIDGPLVSYGGAYVSDGEQVLLSRTISPSVARRSIAYAHEKGLTAFLYRGACWYAEKRDWCYDYAEHVTRIPGKIVNFDSILEQWELEDHLPNKVLLMSLDTSLVSTGFSELSLEFTEDEAFPMLSGPRYLEIMPPHTDKGTGVRRLMEYLGINSPQVMSIGDYYNDLGMFRDSGFAVAMGNAPQEVKDAADYVTASNDDDGVAAAIMKLLLDEK
ncbi:Cof-type HAD-IIB family hydrolase [Parasphaerochaeta coccoides]|uniref:Cof-like hydrolase n=1 Tax=Parasphaerochaeta coccoides (strain ATCC BAA-1237 / DSM 17374 / SPN1) TaxID=760011 RepID=F4GHM3_PARC1|nr:Cof-type HAD-IIB family hydrolase [Parasphaerochaeta coccoides]AEC01561.1 Cof-like hydrolase [Parasphaerochaeta coccoides DSM 17374]